MTVDKANIGKRVKLGDGVLHKEYAGVAGVVVKAVKNRDVYRVELDEKVGRFGSYDASPENVIFIDAPVCTHPATRQYWWTVDGDNGPELVGACCDCGKALAGAAQ